MTSSDQPEPNSGIPDEAMRRDVPEGTPLSDAAESHLAPFWCSAHGVRFDFDARKGGYLPQLPDDDYDARHPDDVPLRDPGALPTTCGDSLGHDPAQWPNAGPQSLDRRAHRHKESS